MVQAEVFVGAHHILFLNSLTITLLVIAYLSYSNPKPSMHFHDNGTNFLPIELFSTIIEVITS